VGTNNEKTRNKEIYSKAIKVGVIGASGYSGAELLRLIAGHEGLDLTVVTGHSSAGLKVSSVYPHLPEYSNHIFESYEHSTQALQECQLLFLALPHGEAAKVAIEFSKAPLIIDLSGDHRLLSPIAYDEWYGKSHPNPTSLPDWVYGLPELFRSPIEGAKRIANPGCYPTAVALAVAPLIETKIIEPQITAVCISGTSGAGRTSAPEFQFSHSESNVRAYKLITHQHTPEIEQTLTTLTNTPVTVSFTPLVGPYTRGILATVTATLSQAISQKSLFDLYRTRYEHEPFVFVTDYAPDLKAVRGSNCCIVHPLVDQRLHQVKICSVIDNLVKGAAGQAIQNANIALGFPENIHLPLNGFYP